MIVAIVVHYHKIVMTLRHHLVLNVLPIARVFTDHLTIKRISIRLRQIARNVQIVIFIKTKEQGLDNFEILV